ncbi:nicotinamide N-methyltransferase-like [Hyla sarda]|uniref:nicotinamide N-methyltransferase-like n=1 Tax=Hyla sarda TaxID=327740 RepID=UPI0024C386AA|nr:nicotinamide N-methyltransferase-like [Hyla sarda]
MDSGSRKIYHEHGFDSRQFLEHYVSDKADKAHGEDSLKFPIENLTKIFTEGHIRGHVLIDFSLGSIIHHLYSACEFFKHIIVLKVSDRCILELKRWLDTRTGAFEWEHAAKLHVEIQGSSDQSHEKEEKLKSIIQHVVKINLEKENMTDPIVLPPADCIICAWLIGAISKDQDDYIKNLRKFSRLLKPGGHLILFGALDTTYYTVGKEKLHYVTYDEDFLRKALVGEGFIIDYCKVQKKVFESDLIDYSAVICISAHRK